MVTRPLRSVSTPSHCRSGASDSQFLLRDVQAVPFVSWKSAVKTSLSVADEACAGGGVPLGVGPSRAAGVGVDVARGRGVGLTIRVAAGLGVGDGVTVGSGVDVGATVGTGVGVVVGSGVDVAVGCGVAVAVGSGVFVGWGVDVLVGLGVRVSGLAVAVGCSDSDVSSGSSGSSSEPQATVRTRQRINAINPSVGTTESRVRFDSMGHSLISTIFRLRNCALL